MVSKRGAQAVTCFLSLITIMTAAFAMPLSFAQENERSVPFPPQKEFSIPATNGSVTFALSGSYSTATLEDDFWDFTGLNLTGDSSPFPIVSGVWLSISAQDSQVTITKFNRLDMFPPAGSGSLEYTVSGTGGQAVNVHYYYNKWLSYAVNIDGKDKAENDGWNVTQDGWLTITGAKSQVRITYGARSPTTITTSDEFPIPQINGTINFGATGTFVYAELKNNTWLFQNLILNGIAPMGAPHWALAISAKNSNVTVTSFLAPFGTMDNGWLNYTVAGEGIQTFNANIDGLSSFPLKYNAYTDAEQRYSWIVSEDDWVTVTGARGNVSITFAQIIPDWFYDLPNRGSVNTSPDFSSICIASAAITVIVSVVVIAVLRRARGRREIYKGNRLHPDSGV